MRLSFGRHGDGACWETRRPAVREPVGRVAARQSEVGTERRRKASCVRAHRMSEAVQQAEDGFGCGRMGTFEILDVALVPDPAGGVKPGSEGRLFSHGCRRCGMPLHEERRLWHASVGPVVPLSPECLHLPPLTDIRSSSGKRNRNFGRKSLLPEGSRRREV